MFSSGKNHLTTKDNRGLTLIELLVAVVIFSIAIVPMLYAFVYATGFNFKAQQTMQSTGIAQAIIEKAKSPGVTLDEIEAAIMGDTLLDPNVFSWGTPTDNGSHSYRIEDVRAVNLTEDTSSRRIYDVEITMSPGSTFNTSVLRSMSDATANFTDATSDFTPGLLLNADQSAEDKLVELIRTNTFVDSHCTLKDDTGNTVDPTSVGIAHLGSFFSESDIDRDNLIIRRVIHINCTSTGVTMNVDYFCGGFYKVVGGTRSKTSVLTVSKSVSIGGSDYTVTCSGGINSLSTSYSIITTDNYNPSAGDTPFYKAMNGANTTFSLCGSATDALFFYYYPGYQTTTSSDKANIYDSFIINTSINAADVTDSNGVFDMYFYKQYNSVYTNAQLNEGENNYAPFFYINNTSSTMTVNFYNNFLNDVRDTDFYDSTYTVAAYQAHGSNFAAELQSNGTSSLLDTHGLFENKTLLPDSPAVGSLYDWDGTNVIPYESVATTYSITVTVYKDNETTPIETMSGEVINW